MCREATHPQRLMTPMVKNFNYEICGTLKIAFYDNDIIYKIRTILKAWLFFLNGVEGFGDSRLV